MLFASIRTQYLVTKKYDIFLSFPQCTTIPAGCMVLLYVGICGFQLFAGFFPHPAKHIMATAIIPCLPKLVERKTMNDERCGPSMCRARVPSGRHTVAPALSTCVGLGPRSAGVRLPTTWSHGQSVSATYLPAM